MPRDFTTADLSDVHDIRLIQKQFRCFGKIPNFQGKISTVRCLNDNSQVKNMLNTQGHGKVLVVDADGLLWQSMVGDNLARNAIENGWNGVIVNGVIRDSHEINSMQIGIKALGVTPIKTDKKGAGETDVPLHFGACRIEPGNWIYADEDGVIVSDDPLIQ